MIRLAHPAALFTAALAALLLASCTNIFVTLDNPHDPYASDYSGPRIATVAGDGSAGYSGDNGQATAAELNAPLSVAVDGSGDLYIADAGDAVIRKVSASGIITTVAGDGIQGYSGDGGPATAAELDHPSAVAVDAAGDLFIADSGNCRIREVSGGIISTVVGDGACGYGGDGGAASYAELNHPTGILVTGSGTMYIADARNDRIREVSNGTITTVAGDGVAGYSGDGGPSVSAELDLAGSGSPAGLALNSGGSLFFADTANQRIRMVSTQGIITTVAGNGRAGYSGDGGAAASASLDEPEGVAVDAAGDLFIADSASNVIREVAEGGTISTVAGDGSWGNTGNGGAAIIATLAAPEGIALDSAGNLYITSGSVVRRVNF